LAERGDDEARIGLALSVLGFGDHPPVAAPTVARRPHEVLEAPGGDAGCLALHGRFAKLGRDLLDQPHVLRQAEQVIDAVFLTPHHQGLARKA
jgi:hypothetical protein